MDEKRSAFFTIMLLSAIILIFTAADFIQEDRTFSETENKLLADRPESALFSQVVRIVVKGDARFEYGCRFLELTESDQEQITRNIFAAQRQRAGHS